MFKIIPDTEKYDNVKNVARISYCYLHGKLEEMVGFDIFGFADSGLEDVSDAGYISPGSIADGVYDCDFEGNKCTFFYWNGSDKHGRHRGLAVLNDDEEALNYAKECYEKKVSHL